MGKITPKNGGCRFPGYMYYFLYIIYLLYISEWGAPGQCLVFNCDASSKMNPYLPTLLASYQGYRKITTQELKMYVFHLNPFDTFTHIKQTLVGSC